jgi:hypothetical protein
MSPLEQGRFCLLCQKNVIDFTHSSDREILEAFKNDKKLCGRFSESQLDRDLLVRKEKSSIWSSTAATIVSFIGLGTNEVVAQENVKVEQTDKKVLSDAAKTSNEEIEVSGIVYDERDIPLPGANLIVKGTTTSTQTDFDGKFSLKVKKGDTIIFAFISYENKEVIVNNISNFQNIKMIPYDGMNDADIVIINGAICVKRSFFGQVFHSIGIGFDKIISSSSHPQNSYLRHRN